MTCAFSAVRCMALGLAVSLLGAALLGAPAQAGQTQASTQTQGDAAPAPAPGQTGQAPLPVGAVGFGWG